MSSEAAKRFLTRYVRDEEFRLKADRAGHGTGFARKAGYRFSKQELERVAEEIISLLHVPTITAVALYGNGDGPSRESQ